MAEVKELVKATHGRHPTLAWPPSHHLPSQGVAPNTARVRGKEGQSWGPAARSFLCCYCSWALRSAQSAPQLLGPKAWMPSSQLWPAAEGLADCEECRGGRKAGRSEPLQAVLAPQTQTTPPPPHCSAAAPTTPDKEGPVPNTHRVP